MKEEKTTTQDDEGVSANLAVVWPPMSRRRSQKGDWKTQTFGPEVIVLYHIQQQLIHPITPDTRALLYVPTIAYTHRIQDTTIVDLSLTTHHHSASPHFR